MASLAGALSSLGGQLVAASTPTHHHPRQEDEVKGREEDKNLPAAESFQDDDDAKKKGASASPTDKFLPATELVDSDERSTSLERMEVEQRGRSQGKSFLAANSHEPWRGSMLAPPMKKDKLRGERTMIKPQSTPPSDD